MMGRWRWMVIDLSIFATICWICSSRTVVLAAESPIVRIINGTLEGILLTSRKGREFAAFKGIPYAQPPIGDLRFEPPKPSESWTGVRSAKNDSSICIQRDIFMHQEAILGVEDCLYLNVYSPKIPSNEDDPRRMNYPVMVWLHGGGFVSGSGHSAYHGPEYLLDRDIVLVTFNYRLGPLGFLSTEDLVTPGNQGMKDQSQSIRWVNENIAIFGGDPDRITIFGASAGGASAHYHMISPLSRGLFHRVISQSGTVLCPWALTRPGIASNQAKRLGNLLKCPIENSILLINCLKKKNPVDIIATDRAFQVFDYDPMIPFRVVIEPDHPGAFINEEPAQSLKSGNVAAVPWMTGTTSNEGALKVAGIYGLKEKKYETLLNGEFMKLAPISLLYEHTCPKESKDNVTESIREFYLGDNDIDESMRMNLVDLYTDAWFFIAADNSVRDHFKTLGCPIYYYYFAYRGSLSFSILFGDTERNYGVAHGDDLQYIFPVDERLRNTSPTEEDYKMIDVMTNLWVNFAESGNPTPEITPEIPVKWSAVKTSRLESFHIGGSRNLRMTADLFPVRVNFWASIPYRGNIKLTVANSTEIS